MSNRPWPCLACLSLLLPVLTAAAPLYQDPAAPLEARVQDALDRMTLAEKVGLCAGKTTGDWPRLSGVPRLGIPDMLAHDGPRAAHRGGSNTCFPSGIALGASWDPRLAQRMGQVLGQSSRAGGGTMIFAPALNILRDPLGGRWFEYFTEDPFLNARLAAAVVRGIQSQGVAACPKHLACNNRERNRNEYLSMVDERALREIYLPGFEAAWKDGGAWAYMTAANGLNGDLCSDSRWLLQQVVKDEWGFDGLVLTDFCHTRSCEKAALAGLDVSMPGTDDWPAYLFGGQLLRAVEQGRVPASALDDKARRVLRVLARCGLLDANPDPTRGGAANLPWHHRAARHVAEEGAVLLKNGGLLPLRREAIRHLLVLGPNADRRLCVWGAGGSSGHQPPYEITPLEGLRQYLGEGAFVQHIPYAETSAPAEVLDLARFCRTPDGQPGLLAQFYAGDGATPVLTRTEATLNHMWEMRSPGAAIPTDHFRATFTGTLTAPADGEYSFTLGSDDGSRLLIGGQVVVDNGGVHAFQREQGAVALQAGRPVPIVVEYAEITGDASLVLEWQRPVPPEARDAALAEVRAAARRADAVVVCAGLDHTLDSEGWDRKSLRFPPAQTALIRAAAAANPATAVVLINGSPLELSDWLDAAPAVLEAWYPGMEGGAAIARLLFGEVSPSGKLPFTWYERLRDWPCVALGTQDDARVNYTEGLLTGYRYADARGVSPLFPFGFGLSYTTFAYSGLHLSRASLSAGEPLSVQFRVTNTGARAGMEVAQVYVSDLHSDLPRPPRELKAFTRLALAPGQTRTAMLRLDPRALAFYDPARHGWVTEPGAFRISVGSSSRDLRLAADLTVQ
jgi:beta-glucosidase